ncbi:MAG: hypothetical protein VX733_11300 [Candidatus Latescibacterota bacterium]|nr:hypothetical protein [Candidatus Latescibacterota bacterium]
MTDAIPGAADAIRARGIEHSSFNGLDIDIPLSGIFALSAAVGGGAHALALEVLAVESRRRYLLAMSPFERESLGGVGTGVTVDSMEGLPPVQRHPGPLRRGSRVIDRLHLEADWTRWIGATAQVICPQCGGLCRSFHVDAAVKRLLHESKSLPMLVVAPLQLTGGVAAERVALELVRGGFRRLQIDGELVRLDDEGVAVGWELGALEVLDVVIDRITTPTETRLAEALRSARAVAHGRTRVVLGEMGENLWLNQALSCQNCGEEREEPNWGDLLSDASPGQLSLYDVRLAGTGLSQLREGLTSRSALDLLSEPTSAEGDEAAKRLCRAFSAAVEADLGDLPLWRREADLSTAERALLSLVAACLRDLGGMLHIVETPFSSLDEQSAQLALSVSRSLVDRGATVIVLDADPELAERVDGVIAIGPAAEETAPKRIRRAARVGPTTTLRIQAGETAVEGVLDSDLDLEFPLHSLVGITGPRGSGKSRLLDLLSGAAAEGRRGSRSGFCIHAPGVRCAVTINAGNVARAAGKRRAMLVDLLGVERHLARYFAASPAAQAVGFSVEAFLLDRPGGRCPGCEGRGRIDLRLGLVEDLVTVCGQCQGKRFRDEILQMTAKGHSVVDVLEMSVAAATAHFHREVRIREVLDAALRFGLGPRCLGTSARDLEPSERVRAEISSHAARAGRDQLILLDRPFAGDHPLDLESAMRALQALSRQGVSIVVAEATERLDPYLDWKVDLAPGSLSQIGRVLHAGPVGDVSTTP